MGLGKYNKSENEFFAKVFGGLLYLAEYIVILPFVIFFWFTIFSLFLIVLTENLNVAQVLTLSVVIVAAIRITAYFKRELSKDLAKLIPFTLLGVSLVNPGFFNFERILSHLGEIPSFFNQVFIYLAFITTIEILLRFIDFILSLFGKSEKINFGNWEEESEGEEEKDN